MKTSLFLALLLCNLAAADPAPSWAIRGGGPGNDSATLVRTDAAGGIYLAGYFYGTANFGGSNLVSGGATDLVLAKYDSTGAHQWSRSYGATETIIVTGLALDGASNIVVCGYSVGPANLGGLTFPSLGAQDAWLAKYDRQGNHLWSNRYGGPSSDLFNGLVVDLAGNIIVSGWFAGTANFGGTNLVSTFNSAPGVMVAKYAPNGTHIWSETFPAGNGNYGYGVALGPVDSVILAGSFFSWIDFGGGRLTAVSPTYQNIFLAKLDSSGSHVWSKRYGGARGDAALAVTCDHNGDVLAGGKFYQQTDLGGGPVAGSAIDQDGWVAKYSGATGNFIWGNAIKGNNGLWVNSMGSDGEGNALVAGYFYGTFNFGAKSLTSTLNGYDAFVAQYAPTPTGLNSWAVSMGGPSTDGAMCVTANSAGDAVVSGFFSQAAKFGTNTLTSAGSYDGFITLIPSTAPPVTPALAIAVSVATNIYSPGDVVTITATVTLAVGGAPVPAAQVTFSATSATGQVSTFAAATDAAGKAVWLFTVPLLSDSGKWTGTATATKDGFTAATSGFTFCSCSCR